MNSVETKISGSQMEQCQVNMVGEVKDPSQVHAALFGLIKTHVVWHYLVETRLSFLFASSGLNVSSFSAKFDNCRQYTSELMV